MTQITIASHTIPNWQHGGATCTLRILSNDTFVTSNGQQITRNYVRNQTFYQTINCTISGTTITVPQFTIDSTTDSSLPNATYTGILYDSNGTKRIAYFSGYKIPITFGVSAQWSQIQVYNNSTRATVTFSYPTVEQVQQLIDDSIEGISGASLANTYGNSLATAIATIGATPTTLIVDENTTVSTFLTVPATLVLEQRNDAVITITSTGQIRFEGKGVADPMTRKPFFSVDLATDLPNTNVQQWSQANVNTSTDTITYASAHGFIAGQQLRYLPHPDWIGEVGGLRYSHTYYAIIPTSTTLKLASSYTNAIADTAIDLTSQGGAFGAMMKLPFAFVGSIAPEMISTEIVNPGTNSLSDRISILDGALSSNRGTIYCVAGRIITTFCQLGDYHSLLFGPGEHQNTFTQSTQFFLPFYMGSYSTFSSEPGAVIYESSVFGRNSIVHTRNGAQQVHILGNHFKGNGAAFNSSDTTAFIVNASHCSIRDNWFDGCNTYHVGVGENTYTLDSDKTFAASDVNTTTNRITIASHGYRDGVPCTLTTSGGLPAPLAGATTYYVIKIDANTIQLATTYANAVAGVPTAIDLTTQGTGTHTIDVTGNTGANNWLCEHNVIDGNLMTGYVTQLMFVLGGRDLKLTNNRIILDNLNIGFTTNCSIIDIEPNTQFQKITDLEISGNFISTRNIVDSYTRGIHVQSIYTDGVERCKIFNNTMIFAATGDIPTLNVYGIGVDFGANDVEVFGNTIIGAGFTSITATQSKQVNIHDNHCPGGVSRLIVSSLADSAVRDNYIEDIQEGEEVFQFVESDGSGKVTLTYPPGSPEGGAWPWIVGQKVFFNGIEYTITAVEGNETDVFLRKITTSPTFPASVAIQSVAAGAVDTANDEITTPANHLLLTGDLLRVSQTSGSTVPGGLVSGNGNYYVIKTANNKYKLATTYANALAGTPINITDAGVGTNTYNPAWFLRFGSIDFQNNKTRTQFFLNSDTDSRIVSTAFDNTITNIADTAHTADIDDGIIIYTSLSAPRTVTLPNATLLRGKEYTIKDGSGNAGTHAITVDGNGSQTIDGAATYSLATAYGSVKVKSNGVGWDIITKTAGGVGGSTGSTDNAIIRADGTGGSTLQNSSVTIDDSGNVAASGAYRSPNGNTTYLQSASSGGNVTIRNAFSEEAFSYGDNRRVELAAVSFRNARPTQITANQNNYDPSNNSTVVYLSSDAARDITGFAQTLGTATSTQDREYRILINNGSNNITLKHEDATSTAANRFLNSTGADIVLSANQAADLYYDSTAARWRVFKRT